MSYTRDLIVKRIYIQTLIKILSNPTAFAKKTLLIKACTPFLTIVTLLNTTSLTHQLIFLQIEYSKTMIFYPKIILIFSKHYRILFKTIILFPFNKKIKLLKARKLKLLKKLSITLKLKKTKRKKIFYKEIN
jgi:hypothetical protein